MSSVIWIGCFEDNTCSDSYKTSCCLPSCSNNSVNLSHFGLCKFHSYVIKSVEIKPTNIRWIYYKKHSNVLDKDRWDNSLERLLEKKNLTLFNLLSYGCWCESNTSDWWKVFSQSVESEWGSIYKFNHQLILISPIVDFMAAEKLNCCVLWSGVTCWPTSVGKLLNCNCKLVIIEYCVWTESIPLPTCEWSRHLICCSDGRSSCGIADGYEFIGCINIGGTNVVQTHKNTKAVSIVCTLE